MNTIEQIKRVGPVGAAQQLYRDGQGLESNPFSFGTKDGLSFDMEMHRLQRNELKELMGDTSCL